MEFFFLRFLCTGSYLFLKQDISLPLCSLLFLSFSDHFLCLIHFPETLSTEQPTAPTLFPVMQCISGTESKVTVGCLAQNFSPKRISFGWTDDSGKNLAALQYPSAEVNNKYTEVSLIEVPKLDWDSGKPFKCSVTHVGSSQKLEVQLQSKLCFTFYYISGDFAFSIHPDLAQIESI